PRRSPSGPAGGGDRPRTGRGRLRRHRARRAAPRASRRPRARPARESAGEPRRRRLLAHRARGHRGPHDPRRLARRDHLRPRHGRDVRRRRRPPHPPPPPRRPPPRPRPPPAAARRPRPPALLEGARMTSTASTPASGPGASRARREKALLILEDGTVLHGSAYGARGSRLGEVVFTTGMTGYQETLSDPSYAGQIVVQTAPHIGNTGANAQDMESRKVWVRGYAVRDASRIASSYRAEQTLDELLLGSDVVGISDIDTRMLTRRLRETGSLRGGTYSADASSPSQERLLAQVREQPEMTGASFVEEVTIAQPVVLEPEGEVRAHVAAVDLGIKGAAPRSMLSRGLRVHLLPATTSLEDLLALSPDAVFFSNGP